MMIEGMQIQPPRLVISISGDQNEVADPEHLTRILMNGFSETDDLWVITNGALRNHPASSASLLDAVRQPGASALS